MRYLERPDQEPHRSTRKPDGDNPATHPSSRLHTQRQTPSPNTVTSPQTHAAPQASRMPHPPALTWCQPNPPASHDPAHGESQQPDPEANTYSLTSSRNRSNPYNRLPSATGWEQYVSHKDFKLGFDTKLRALQIAAKSGVTNSSLTLRRPSTNHEATSSSDSLSTSAMVNTPRRVASAFTRATV